ncbi:nuclear pore protein seh1, partial [Macrolepiota fuliginosa MF-IS2]
MLQSALIQHAHDDLLTDAAYDFYGLRLATCSLDQKIKIWQLDESSGTWSAQDEWKAHEAPVSKVCWAHPEFGSVLASSSFDRTAKVWEQAPPSALLDSQLGNTTSGTQPQPISRWIERNVMAESKGTVRDIEFAPHYFGLKLATIASDNILRIYECIDQSSLTSWQPLQDIDVLNLPSSSTPTFYSRAHTVALSTPTQTTSTFDKNNFADHAQALSQGLQQNAAMNNQIRHGVGNREADGGWCLSWCKDRYWGEILAASAGTSGVVKVLQLTPSRRHVTLLTLDPSPSTSSNTPAASATTSPLAMPMNPTQPSAEPEKAAQATSAITSLSWAPSCGRSYHLIATGSRDGSVRIWRVQPGEELETDDGKDASESEEMRWTILSVGKVEHKSAVSKVDWNVTGTILSSAGNDGRVRLWKAGLDGEWRSAGSIGVEQAEESEADSGTDQRDID